VNGWLIGRYVNNVGPQHQFYVPAGILRDDGQNTIAIADWSLDETTGGLDSVSLAAAGNQASSLKVDQVVSPGYDAAVYGTPAKLSPVLAVVPSTALASGTFTVKATVTNPTPTALSGGSVALTVPSGWTVSPASAQLGTVAPQSSGTASFSVTAPSAGLTSGTVALLATATFNGSISLNNAATVEVPYASLADSFDNTGITSNSNTNPSANFEGFDGEGTTFSAEGLAADNLTPGATVTAGGLNFTWPNVAVATADNTMAEGQTIAVNGSGSSLGFLASGNNSSESGTGTIYYTDGSTQSFTLSVGNFWYPSGSNGNPTNTTIASVNYANYPTGSSGHTVYIFEQSVPIDSSKTVAAIGLPSLGDVAGYNAALHIFAVSVG
jgi:hypothetical protein